MSTGRTSLRHRRRFHVTVGPTAVFTADVGAGGFSAELMRVPPPGTPVQGKIRLNGLEVGYEGEIAWARAGSPHLSMRGRIGVRFTSLPPEAARMLSGPALSGVT